MSNAVFVTAASVKCGHGGVVPTGGLTSTSKLTVQGKPVMTSTQLVGAAFDTSCGQTGSSQTQCKHVASVLTTVAARLTVGSTAVVTETLTGTTDGVPVLNLLTGSAGQSLLTAA
jgi:enamine deaminase RidA (YjgF/YER057c/UK114 family)